MGSGGGDPLVSAPPTADAGAAPAPTRRPISSVTVVPSGYGVPALTAPRASREARQLEPMHACT